MCNCELESDISSAICSRHGVYHSHSNLRHHLNGLQKASFLIVFYFLKCFILGNLNAFITFLPLSNSFQTLPHFPTHLTSLSFSLWKRKKTNKSGVWFVLANGLWAAGLPWNVVDYCFAVQFLWWKVKLEWGVNNCRVLEGGSLSMPAGPASECHEALRLKGHRYQVQPVGHSWGMGEGSGIQIPLSKWKR